jgi:hypothetical protein
VKSAANFDFCFDAVGAWVGSGSGWCCARGVAGFGQGFLDSRVNTNVYNAVMAIAGQVSLVNHALAGCIIPSVWLHIRRLTGGFSEQDQDT